MARKQSGKPLNDRALRFVDEYLVDLNGKQAAIRAGYSPKGAEVRASELLRNSKVKEAIAARQAARSISTQLSAQQVITEIARIAFCDPVHLFGPDGGLLKVRDMPEDLRRAIASVKVKHTLGTESEPPAETTEIRFWSKDSALEKLGKHLGLFKDTLKLEGGVRLEITEEIVDASVDQAPDSPPAP